MIRHNRCNMINRENNIVRSMSTWTTTYLSSGDFDANHFAKNRYVFFKIYTFTEIPKQTDDEDLSQAPDDLSINDRIELEPRLNNGIVKLLFNIYQLFKGGECKKYI